MAGPTTAQAIGAFAAQIEALNKRLDLDREDRKEADKEIIANRAAVSRALLELGHSHADNAARLDRIEPVVAMVSSAKSKFAGAMVVLGLIGTLFIFGVVYFKDAILRLIFGG
tara:strand:- start:1715 stop:2053 length:339 start_codon:yes stop_codon:yes gene_type:complete